MTIMRSTIYYLRYTLYDVYHYIGIRYGIKYYANGLFARCDITMRNKFIAIDTVNELFPCGIV